jgi:hypothetical protein
MAWKLFMGGAAHRLIPYMYKVRNPGVQAYYNNKSLKTILEQTGIGEASLLLPDEFKKCPDITDAHTPGALRDQTLARAGTSGGA